MDDEWDDYCAGCTMGLRSFVKSTLKMELFLLSLALPQWMLLSAFAWHEHLLYALVCFVSSFVILSTLQKWETLKYDLPWNFLTVGCCYELITLGLGTFLMKIDVQELMLLVAISLIICGVVFVMCFCIINSYYFPNPYKLPILAILGLMLVFAVLAVGTTFNWPYWPELTIFLFVLSVLITMISAVLISFDNHEILKRGDAFLLGLVLYVNYVLILLACFICYQRVQLDTLDGTKGGWHA